MVKTSLPILASILLVSLTLPVSLNARKVLPIDKLFDREARQLTTQELIETLRTPHHLSTENNAIPPDFECGWRNLGK